MGSGHITRLRGARCSVNGSWVGFTTVCVRALPRLAAWWRHEQSNQSAATTSSLLLGLGRVLWTPKKSTASIMSQIALYFYVVDNSTPFFSQIIFPLIKIIILKWYSFWSACTNGKVATLLSSLYLMTIKMKDTVRNLLNNLFTYFIYLSCLQVTPRDSSLHHFLSKYLTMCSAGAVTLVVLNTVIVHATFLLTYFIRMAQRDATCESNLKNA